MTLTPLLSKLTRAITRKNRDPRLLADRQWTLCPAEETTAPPAIHLPGDLDKITGLMESTTLALETARIEGGPRQHRATVAYQIANAELYDGILYKGHGMNPLRRGPEPLIRPLFSPAITEHIPTAGLACSLNGSVYFSHWITEDLTLNLAVQQFGTPIVAARKPYRHEPDYCRLLQIEQHPVTRAKLGQLIMLNDYGQNSYKRQRYETLRARLRNSVTGPAIHPKVFIRRGASGAARSLVNHAEVEAYLVSQGFGVVDPEHLSVQEITRQLSGASFVVGVEGSHLIHGILNMQQGATLCALQPPFRFNNLHKDYTDCLGMTYGFLTGHNREGGFTIDLDELKAILDKLDAHRPA